ncbi:unnamed protein product [Anisakis simplex]|uniref:Cytochrome b-c1 complex subunit Rieske transmembrane domain-containing protein n=1 Tax=Anisakis simplex TaxID=6269 RepID=A0A3P6S5R4_ANISI|nr:unnamed protein product [Anisakis simplex]
MRRFAHTDVRFPNFDEYRHDATLDCKKAARETEDERRVVPQMIYYGVGGMLALMTAKESVQKMVAFKGMACDQVAQAFTIVNMDEIPEGQTKTYEWQGKPVFVKHRTAHEIEEMKAINISQLRHPESDSQRVKRAEWLVVVGVCTHLGCVPSRKF